MAPCTGRRRDDLRAFPDTHPLFRSLDRLPADLDRRGSLAPIISLALYKSYGSALPVAIYVGSACAISGLTALLSRETRGIDLAAVR
jgi:hypothetical protein